MPPTASLPPEPPANPIPLVRGGNLLGLRPSPTPAIDGVSARLRRETDATAAEQTWQAARGPNAPLAWYGGKYRLAEWIISHFPPHRLYVEPFGGMANVLLRKRPSAVEVFNDLDGRIVNFFRVLRTPEKLAELQRRCELTPYSREEFATLCDLPEPAEDVGRAWWFFVRCRQARGGLGVAALTKYAWATSTRTRRHMPEPVSKYLAALDGLGAVAARFRTILVEQLPAVELIAKYDGPDVLFYCDPPYVGCTRHGGKAATYAVEMTDRDHEKLLDVLGACRGKVLLSGYDSPLYDLRLADWSRSEKATHVQCSNSGEPRREMLWRNW